MQPVLDPLLWTTTHASVEARESYPGDSKIFPVNIVSEQTLFRNIFLARVCRVYHMVYEGINKEGVHALGLATSADGVKWERNSNDPIFERSPPGR